MRYFVLILTAALVLMHPPLAHAERFPGFVMEQFQGLQSEVRDKHDLKSIARYLTETETFANWPQDLDPRLKLYIAIEWFEKKQYAAAEKLLDTIDPFNVSPSLWLYYRASLLIYRGLLKESLQLITRLEGQYPKDRDVLFLKSLYLTQSGDLAGALDLVGQIIKRHKRDGRLYLQRGAMQMLAFSYDQALEDYHKALKFLPKADVSSRQQAYFQMGLIYWKIKMDQEQGERFLQEGLKLDPNSEMVGRVRQALAE